MVLRLPSDQFATPVDAADVAAAAVLLVGDGKKGIYKLLDSQCRQPKADGKTFCAALHEAHGTGSALGYGADWSHAPPEGGLLRLSDPSEAPDTPPIAKPGAVARPPSLTVDTSCFASPEPVVPRTPANVRSLQRTELQPCNERPPRALRLRAAHAPKLACSTIFRLVLCAATGTSATATTLASAPPTSASSPSRHMGDAAYEISTLRSIE